MNRSSELSRQTEVFPDRSPATAADRSGRPSGIRVWDLGVRLFHWALVVAVGLATATGFLAPRNWLDIHLAAGTAIAGLVIFRLVWGWTGSTYARFRSFAFGPRAVFERIREIAGGTSRRYLGHNPLGAAMVFALLVVLGLLVASGVVTLGGVDKQGPLAFAISFAVGSAGREIHELLTVALLALIGGHLGGVALESLHSRENLVSALITGRKATAPRAVSVAPVRSQPRRAVLLMIVVVMFGGGIVILNSGLSGLGVPTEPLDAGYVGECGGCHTAYHPSLAPSATWTALMRGLPDHFGEDASLDPSTTARLAAYLIANSAEVWDTRAANLLRVRGATDPLRITQTPAWQRLHRSIPPGVFASKSVGARGACGACHQDASTGRFDPQAIVIPKEAHP